MYFKNITKGHGNIREGYCTNPNCNKKYGIEEIKQNFKDGIPMCDSCDNSIIKPNVVLFGESLSQGFKNVKEGIVFK
jgi:NAD-dependent SIR2 family protein deacetylase